MTPSGSFELYLQLATQHRPVLQRIFFAAVLGLLVFYAITRQLLFQQGGNPLFYPELDPTYWLFMTLGLHHWLQSPAIILVDFFLFITAAGAVVWPRRVTFPALFAAAYFIWFVLYNGTMGHHYAFFGVLFLSVPFALKGGFGYMLLFMRFVFCFIYGTAALWKIGRGNLFYPLQTRTSLLLVNLDVLAENSGTLRHQVLQWLVANPVPAHSLWIAMIALELIFLVGFITLRFDRWIGVAYLLFALGGWYLFGVWNYENLLFLLTLLPVLQWVGKLSKNEPKIGA